MKLLPVLLGSVYCGKATQSIRDALDALTDNDDKSVLGDKRFNKIKGRFLDKLDKRFAKPNVKNCVDVSSFTEFSVENTADSVTAALESLINFAEGQWSVDSKSCRNRLGRHIRKFNDFVEDKFKYKDKCERGGSCTPMYEDIPRKIAFHNNGDIIVGAESPFEQVCNEDYFIPY